MVTLEFTVSEKQTQKSAKEGKLLSDLLSGLISTRRENLIRGLEVVRHLKLL